MQCTNGRDVLCSCGPIDRQSHTSRDRSRHPIKLIRSKPCDFSPSEQSHANKAMQTKSCDRCHATTPCDNCHPTSLKQPIQCNQSQHRPKQSDTSACGLCPPPRPNMRGCGHTSPTHLVIIVALARLECERHRQHTAARLCSEGGIL
eukprot:363312-Chlamydomonas_euryale.AAC.1